MKFRVITGLIVALLIATTAAGQDKTPSQIYGPLFEAVQMQHVFPDGKTFVDAVPHDSPTIVMQRYRNERGTSGFDLAAFVQRNFVVQRPKESAYRSIPGEDVCTHIDKLWQVLERNPHTADHAHAPLHLFHVRDDPMWRKPRSTVLRAVLRVSEPGACPDPLPSTGHLRARSRAAHSCAACTACKANPPRHRAKAQRHAQVTLRSPGALHGAC